MIVPGAGVGRTKKPKVVRHPPTMWLGGTTISRGYAYRHRPVATCCSGIVRFVCLRVHLSGLVSPVGRTVKREGNVPTQYDHCEGSEGLERHVRRSARFFFPRRFLHQRSEACYQQSGPTTSDLAERFTGPSRECMEWLGEMGPSAYEVCSCFAGCASRALESGALPLTSASSRGRQSVNPRAADISTDRQTDALSDSKFSEVIGGTLGVGSRKSPRAAKVLSTARCRQRAGKGLKLKRIH